eukprot:TRINITY_DN12916_c0_g1_i1.p1 TRINITY_DN12916_c0_g1~~TRINITY_DN12916_c0_g1_i1.p1  ORF type:complete len:195 (-),score=34.26 TRINITY_DN12916_c0_g1_i1:425-949(-)
MLRSLVGSEMCIRDRVSTQSTGAQSHRLMATSGAASPSQHGLEHARAILGSMMQDQHHYRSMVSRIGSDSRVAQVVADEAHFQVDLQAAAAAAWESERVRERCVGHESALYEYWSQRSARRDPYFHREPTGALAPFMAPWPRRVSRLPFTHRQHPTDDTRATRDQCSSSMYQQN